MSKSTYGQACGERLRRARGWKFEKLDGFFASAPRRRFAKRTAEIPPAFVKLNQPLDSSTCFGHFRFGLSEIRRVAERPGESMTQAKIPSNRGIILKIVPRRRGRPRGSTVVHPDFRFDIWIAVQLHRICARVSTGKTPTVGRACEELAAQGGFLSAVGGNVEALAEENARREKRRVRFEIDSTGLRLPSTTGSILVSHAITNPRTLQARFSEADRMVRSDRRVRFAWMNICRQRLGRRIKQAAGPRM
jgi:hypothetical protein